MAPTRDYLDYLNNQIEIAPANSQEELDAAQLLQSLMADHGLDTTIQEFDAPAAGTIAHDALYVTLFLGMMLSGILGTAVGVVGLLLALASVTLLALRFGGKDILQGIGSRSKSQNVVGVHRACGPLVVKGNRPIVIVAHYDTPNESLLARTPVAQYVTIMKRASFWCVSAVALCALLQAVGPIPPAARHALWVVGILAALPLLMLGVDGVYGRFAPCTTGANDNKASVAAMLGVMDKVRPADDQAKRWAAARPAPAEEVLSASEAADEEPLEAKEPVAEEASQLEDGEGEPSGPDAPKEIPAGLGELGHRASETFSGLASRLRGGVSGVREVLSHRPGDEAPGANPLDGSAPGMEPEEEDGPTFEPNEPVPSVLPSVTARVETDGRHVRRGAEFVESLGILPDGCDIVYDLPARPELDLSSLPEVPEMPAFSADDFYVAPDLSGLEPGADEEDQRSGYVPSFFQRSHTFEEPAAPAQETADAKFEQIADEEALASDSVFDRLKRAFAGWRERLAQPSAPEREPVGGLELEDAGNEVSSAESDLAEGPGQEAEPPEEVGHEALGAESENVLGKTDDLSDSQATMAVPALSFLDEGDSIEFESPDKDTSGLDNLSEDGSVSRPAEQKPVPTPVDDPSWGTSEFRPRASSVARRAVLFDLPDPSTVSRDPFALDPDSTAPTPRAAEGAVEEVAQDEDHGATRGTQEPIGFVGADASPAPTYRPDQTARAGKRGFGLFGRRHEEEADTLGEWLGVGDDFDAKKDGREIGSWDNFADEPESGARKDGWKGGATSRFDLRLVDGEPVEGDMGAQDAEELRDAILSMSDDELLAHDIWFVATGASTMDHAGIRAFLSDFRKAIRGAFVINLNCVGAGDLTVLTSEGSSNTRRADRRMVRLMGSVAQDLHVELGRSRYNWDETDATPAMQSAMRAATIAGLSSDGSFALSRSEADEPENVNPAQVVDVAEIVAEVIRRS